MGAMTRCIELMAVVGSFLLILLTMPFSLCVIFKVVQEYERAVVFRMGRLKAGPQGPGTFFVIPCIDNCVRVDLRTVSFDVPPQEVLTKDSVTVSVDAVVYYRIKEPLNAVVKIANYSHSTRLLAASTLRTVLGTRSLAEILAERETISHTMQAALDEATEPWGVKVERVEIKDVRLPVQLQRAMAAEAEAAREARAKVIAAEGEMRSSRALKEASDVLSMSPAALQIPADAEQHIGREELDHHLPAARGAVHALLLVVEPIARMNNRAAWPAAVRSNSSFAIKLPPEHFESQPSKLIIPKQTQPSSPESRPITAARRS
ncbi:band 7 protein AGAP004871-like isoform X2 [Nasonia vitripennis]|nr:band 7 protein AGAP004871-like isoform X2 [Nasonia vitripennis]XP_031782590.1 band 7 protein AGAP004871-like isoform X2 [Nasonia vitripennis]XP_032453980.1 band 7 protein AGAP004871-like isoform X2 [Nasonia vitripennis]